MKEGSQPAITIDTYITRNCLPMENTFRKWWFPFFSLKKWCKFMWKQCWWILVKPLSFLTCMHTYIILKPLFMVHWFEYWVVMFLLMMHWFHYEVFMFLPRMHWFWHASVIFLLTMYSFQHVIVMLLIKMHWFQQMWLLCFFLHCIDFTMKFLCFFFWCIDFSMTLFHYNIVIWKLTPYIVTINVCSKWNNLWHQKEFTCIIFYTYLNIAPCFIQTYILIVDWEIH